jgi:hypothetical protein
MGSKQQEKPNAPATPFDDIEAAGAAGAALAKSLAPSVTPATADPDASERPRAPKTSADVQRMPLPPRAAVSLEGLVKPGPGKYVTAIVPIRMRNRSKDSAFFKGQRIKPGKTFTLAAGEVVGGWMEPVLPAQRDDLAAALEASPKTRGANGVQLKSRSTGTLETGANRDEGI